MHRRFSFPAWPSTITGRITRCGLLLVLLAAFFSVAAMAQSTPEPSLLEPGQPVEGELAAGATQAYRIKLSRGQFLHIAIEQPGIDVTATLLRPNGESIVVMNLRNAPGTESLSYEADQDGLFRLEIRPTATDPKPGKYRVTSTIKPAAAPLDRVRITAEKLLLDASLKLVKINKDSLLAALTDRRRALELWRRLGDRDWERSTLFGIGRIYHQVYSKLTIADAGPDFFAEPKLPFALAEESYQQSLAIARELKYEHAEAESLYWLGQLYFDRRAYDKAIQSSSLAQEIYQRLGDHNAEGLSLLNIGADYVQQGDMTQGIDFNQRAASVLKEAGDLRNEVQALDNIGIAFGNSLNHGKPENFLPALDHFNQALQESRAAKDRSLEARELGNLAWIYEHEKPRNEQKLLDLYGQALALYREVKERDNEAATLRSLAAIHDRLKEHDQAIQAYQQALAISQETRNRRGETAAQRSLGDALLGMAKTDQALDAYVQELKLRVAAGDDDGIDAVQHRIIAAFEAIDANATAEAAPLEPDKAIERTFAPGDFTQVADYVSPSGETHSAGSAAHRYRVTLKAGDFFHLKFDWWGNAQQVSVYGPDQKRLIKSVTLTRDQGENSVSLVATESGDYRVVVRAYHDGAKTARYTLRFDPPHSPAEQDQARLLAEQTLAEAQELELKGTPDSYASAAAKYAEAGRLFHQLGDKYDETLTTEMIAFLDVYPGKLNDQIKALDYFKQAMSSYEAIGERRRAAIMLYFIATIYTNPAVLEKVGQAFYETSLDDLLKALAAFRDLGDRQWEADTLQSVYFHYISENQRDQALDYLNQAVELNRSLAEPNNEAMADSNLGVVYLELGDPARSIDYNERAAALYRSTMNRYGEVQALDVLAEAYGKEGKYDQALAYLKQTLPAYWELSDDFSVFRALTKMGVLYQKLGDKAKAKEYFDQALEGARSDHYTHLQSPPLFGLGTIFAGQGNAAAALDYFQQALALNRQFSEHEDEAASLFQIAVIQRDRGDLDQARQQIEAALVIVESLRSQVKNQDLRSSYFATVRDYYEFYIDLLMRLHHQNPAAGFESEALHASERARARSLLETLAEANADIRQGVDAKLLEREHTLQSQLNAKAQEQMRLPGGPRTEARAQALAQDIEGLTTDFQQVESEIRTRNPRYAALTQPQPLTVKEIQTQILDQDTVLLEYSLGTERSYVWVVTPDSIKSYELPKRDEIENSARRFYDLLKARNLRVKDETPAEREARVAAADKEIPEAALALSKIVLAPVAAQLGKKRLAIVADGALQYIPFAALADPSAGLRGEPQPLMVEHEIVSLASASTLAVIRKEVAGRAPAPKMIAVLADPVFMKNDERIKPETNSGSNGAPSGPTPSTPSTEGVKALQLVENASDTGAGNGLVVPRLPGSRKEAEAIVAMVPQGDNKLALDFAASRELATSAELSQYRYIHFSTHGFLNSVHPELSGIVFSLVNERGEAEDGFLRAHEVFNLKLPAELVVLSACETGIGKAVKGEGLVSLTRGFMYAGAPRVVVSLWSVSELGTGELMVRFYRSMLKDGLRPAAALRAAQISLMKENRFASAFYWAPFILQGEWR